MTIRKLLELSMRVRGDDGKDRWHHAGEVMGEMPLPCITVTQVLKNAVAQAKEGDSIPLYARQPRCR